MQKQKPDMIINKIHRCI